ncbi:hypothetical protein [Streptomyces sp. NPDC051677]|uniref:hypothetical protein n=1 Tax=Streptomyces sp. NPDC051677 TaxID=3365669 RepID=UPI0037D91EE4
MGGYLQGAVAGGSGSQSGTLFGLMLAAAAIGLVWIPRLPKPSRPGEQAALHMATPDAGPRVAR